MSENHDDIREALLAGVCARGPLPRSLLIDGEAQPCCAREHPHG